MLSQSVGASNMIIYPGHSCSKPYKPYQFNNQWEIDSYKNNYNRYISCMQDYIDGAYDDIRMIQRNIDNAISEAKNLY